MKGKITIIIVSLVILTFAGLFLLYYFWFTAPEKKIAAECQGYIPAWPSFIECSGVVAINDGWDIDYISIRDHVHDYSIAHVYNRNQYVFAEGKLFVINREYIENSASDGVETTYYQTLFQNGKMVDHPYSAISEIPTYLSVDVQTGEVNSYNNIDEVPKENKEYFLETENK